MCIRDRSEVHTSGKVNRISGDDLFRSFVVREDFFFGFTNCLLYTSDAADERSSVDLGGRRIIKKKKQWRRVRRDQCEATTLIH